MEEMESFDECSFLPVSSEVHALIEDYKSLVHKLDTHARSEARSRLFDKIFKEIGELMVWGRSVDSEAALEGLRAEVGQYLYGSRRCDSCEIV